MECDSRPGNLANGLRATRTENAPRTRLKEVPARDISESVDSGMAEPCQARPLTEHEATLKHNRIELEAGIESRPSGEP